MPENVEKVVLGSCALHFFFVRRKAPSQYTPSRHLDTDVLEEGQGVDGSRKLEQLELQPIAISGSNKYKHDSKMIRDDFCKYINTLGRVPWQDKFF